MNIGDTSDLKDEEKMDSKSMTVAHYACPNTLNLDSCSAGSSQTAVIDQNVGSSGDTKHQNDLDLKLWKLRANHIQRILSMPHQEHCPLDSYSRCKKLGIDFNVGSGMKQNLDPKLLTNGIMVELNTFATALLSAQKHFITDILEHNFDLNFENELSRSAFADDVMRKIQIVRLHKSNLCTRQHLVKRPFELPDVRCIEEPSHAKTLHCPKCYQDQKFHEDESDSGHMHHRCPHTMSDTVSADVKCTTQKHAKDASSTFSTTEETIMNSNPHCKKIGLNLCVDKDLPKDKLDMHVLTNSVMKEVVQFARRLCGTNNVIINDVLEHNFNIGKQSLDLNPAVLFSSRRKQNEPAWFNEVFVIQSYSIKPPGYIGKAKRESALHRSERMEVIRKRQLALQTKQERTNMPSGSGENPYPACTVIGLDLDVTSNSREKVILELKLLTRAVVFEMHKFATLEAVNYYPRTVFDILDYNFDLSSQHYRRWEFSIATALKIQTMVKEYCKKDDNTEGADEVFKLPFMLDPKTSRQRVIKRQNIKSTNSSMDTATESNSSCVDIHTHFLTSSNMLSSLATVNSNVTSKIGNQPDDRGFYGDEEQTQTPRNAPNEWNMEQEEIRTGNYYTCPLEESDLESDEVSDSENTGKQDHLRNPESFSPSSDIVSELKSSCMGIHAPLFTSTNHQSDIKQKEMETEHNMWKLRSNRVEQILSALTKDFGRFNRSKRVGLEYNVGFGPKQNISVESLKDSLLFEIGKFALAMNSSQKDFTMEILEYNFDVNLPSQHHRNIFASDIMSRVRHLRSYEVAVEFSNEVFELPRLVASINMTGQSEGCVNPELGMSNMGKCHVAPVCPPDSHAETKEHISCRSERLYPLCKEIGLNLHVNNSQPNKKMEINKLTNGAMTEVTNFAEKLCGTFEQICLDILRHNLDFDLQRDSEFAKNILARIPVLIERRNLSVCSKLHKHMKRYDMSTMEKPDSPDNPNLDTCSDGSSQAAVTDQNVGSSADSEHQNDLDLKLWKLRASQIQRILSMSHREYCPFYSYSRCMKLGIDFNVGSGVRQNLDPKLLTNGIMVELNTFTTELYSAQKHFIMEVLEYNFDLNFENELSRSAFAKQILTKIRPKKGQCKIDHLPFELPDTRCIQEPICKKNLPCSKCYQDRNHEVLKDKTDPVHMHHPHPSTRTETDSTDVNCTAQQLTEDPSSTFFTAEETIMEGYPLCKEIGLNLCVDKDKPINKLDTQVLTYGIVNELATFARKLCGPKPKVIIDVLKHNFNIGMLHQHLNPAETLYSPMQKRVTDPDWFNEVFVLNRPRQLKRAPAIQKSNCLESIKKRKLTLHSVSQSQSQSQGQGQGRRVIGSKPNYSIYYPFCSEIGLALDVTSESEEKEKLDLKLLTIAVVSEIHKYASQKTRYYYPRTVFDILDYNFDLSSQHHRRLEFSIATASKLRSIAKRYRKNRNRPDEVFKLPFVFEKEEKMKRKKYSQEKPVKKGSSCVRQVGHHSDVNDVNLLSGVQTKEEPCSHDEDTKSSIDNWMMNVQNPGLVSVGCGSPLQENLQIKKEEYDPHYYKTEPDIEEKYHLQHVNVKTESITGGVEHLVPYEPPGSLGNTVNQNHLENPTSTDIPRESE
ncbi:uncharacterized protein LOC109139082 isoform X3 [Larimichthys crocea]|uniref:uncharacterized protein LOC109139082 isoform X3 n=1 Tax=Larimichthys crocea TaxID=215358 RepID=UPI000F5FA08F|nr:uncharacterized protein LOC109139082 isoform X3 [Larimichthys crocea]